MNTGYEEEPLKPYNDPHMDLNDHGRIRKYPNILYSIPTSCTVSQHLVQYPNILYSIPTSCTVSQHLVQYPNILYSIPTSCTVSQHLVQYPNILYSIPTSCTVSQHLVQYPNILYSIPTSCTVSQHLVQYPNILYSIPTSCTVSQHLVQYPNILYSILTSHTEHIVQCTLLTCNICSAEKMQQMGFSPKEIQESLSENRYDEVCATYYLLGREISTVRALMYTLMVYTLINVPFQQLNGGGLSPTPSTSALETDTRPSVTSGESASPNNSTTGIPQPTKKMSAPGSLQPYVCVTFSFCTLDLVVLPLPTDRGEQQQQRSQLLNEAAHLTPLR